MSTAPASGRPEPPEVGGRSIHVAGTGSFALEVVEYARAAGLTVPALIELVDVGRVGSEAHGLPIIAVDTVPAGAAAAVIGLGGDRLELWSKLKGGWSPGTVIHPLAAVSPSAAISSGCVIGPLVVIGAATVIGQHCLVGRGALIGHHCELGPGSVVNPGANIGGNTHLGTGAQIGIAATVSNGLRIGAGAVVAAGAVVVRDVPEGTRVQGVPARVYSPSGE